VRLGWVLASLLVATTSSLGDGRHGRGFDAAKLEDACIDVDCKLHALTSFEAAIAAVKAGTATHPVRIAYFGDSLTADDQITNALRKRLQDQLGDGGAGFVWIVPPHPFNEHRAMARLVGGQWSVGGVSTVVPGDHLLGLGGSAESSEGDVVFAPLGAFASIDLHYLVQPHGGTVEVLADRKPVTTIDTRGDRKQAAFQKVDIAAGTKRVELRTSHGNVRMFGAAFETRTGAVVDNLGVVNATAKAFAHNNLDEHWKNQLAHRAADLVVIMLGTNEAEWLHRGAGMIEHEKIFDELLSTVRAANPTGSCLVISPLDQLDWRDEKMPPRDSIPAMVDAQHRAAARHGCAFWDTYQWMGGKGSSASWYKRGLVVKDFQHPTSEGAEAIADALYRGLTAPPITAAR
jgi:lysophospholipase L1-like esterase